jgi:hypothetical protein
LTEKEPEKPNYTLKEYLVFTGYACLDLLVLVDMVCFGFVISAPIFIKGVVILGALIKLQYNLFLDYNKKQ